MNRLTSLDQTYHSRLRPEAEIEIESSYRNLLRLSHSRSKHRSNGRARLLPSVSVVLRHAVRVVTVADVDAAVCGVLRLPAGTLQSKARSWAVSHPQMVAIYLCRKHTAATYGEISKHFGAKTHSTAVASEKKVRAWLDKDQSVAIGDQNWRVKELIDRIERELQR